jgi:hypothetical protein
VNTRNFNLIHPTKRSYKTNFVIPISQNEFTYGTSCAPKRSYKTNFSIHISQNVFTKGASFSPTKRSSKLVLSFLCPKNDLSVETLRLVLIYSLTIFRLPTRCTYNFPIGSFVSPPWFFNLNLLLNILHDLHRNHFCCIVR